MLNFFRSCGFPLYEGYGLTEGCGQLAVNSPGVFKLGTVGKPLDGIEVKLKEDGEIIANGEEVTLAPDEFFFLNADTIHKRVSFLKEPQNIKFRVSSKGILE